MTSPPPTPQLLRVQNLPQTSVPRPGVKGRRKSGFKCKSKRRCITFRPQYKNKESAPKIVYLSLIENATVVAFFNDIYNTFEGNNHTVASRLFEMHVDEPGRKYSIDKNPPLHCKGLFVFPTRTSTIFVCNPATKEVITLPRSSNEHVPHTLAEEALGGNVRVGFGFVQPTQVYKVTQFFYRSYDIIEKSYSLGFEVFTIGLSTSWRVLAKDPPYPIERSCTRFTGKCIFFHICRSITREAPNAFLCFNVKNERFSLLFPPASVRHIAIKTMMLSTLQRRLCLSLMTANNTKFCVFTNKMKETMKRGWIPRYCFNIEPLVVTIEPIAEYQGNLLAHVFGWWLTAGKMKFYDSKEGSFEDVDTTSVDVKMDEEEGCTVFRGKPWFSFSAYEESSYHLESPLVFG